MQGSLDDLDYQHMRCIDMHQSASFKWQQSMVADTEDLVAIIVDSSRLLLELPSHECRVVLMIWTIFICAASICISLQHSNDSAAVQQSWHIR
jgi:hypothetical protein